MTGACGAATGVCGAAGVCCGAKEAFVAKDNFAAKDDFVAIEDAAAKDKVAATKISSVRAGSVLRTGLRIAEYSAVCSQGRPSERAPADDAGESKRLLRGGGGGLGWRRGCGSSAQLRDAVVPQLLVFVERRLSQGVRDGQP